MPQVVRAITALLCLPLFAEQIQSVQDRLAHGGDILLHQEMQITAEDHEWDIDAHRTTIQLASDFQGRAAIVISGARNIRIRGLTIDGNRAQLHRAPEDSTPSTIPFSGSAHDSGVLIKNSDGIRLEDITLKNIAGFAILASASGHIRIAGAHVSESGSRDSHAHNNRTGGILLEEGTHDFDVTNCDLQDVLGNGIWTHSLANSPRNADGRITENKLSGVARDAIQIGNATRVLVEKNTGARIGYPADAVERDGDVTPVALDTGGNTDATQFRDNSFEEVNGKCIDLDGFHDGEVRGNSCINSYDRNAYPNSHFGIVMNNSNPQVESRNVLIWGNRIEGFLYGGLVVIGSGHRVSHNHFLHLNLAHCNEEAAQYRCRYAAGEPDLLRSGIYLRNKAERKTVTRDNIIEDNEISGFGMGARCVIAGPGVDATQNRIDRNDCTDDIPVSASLQLPSITREIAFTSLRTGGSSKFGNKSSSPSHQLE